jgi:hypothetical protein
MFVRLTRKLAEVVNGIDISHCAEGDVIELPDSDAQMLIAERWAEAAADAESPTCSPKLGPDASKPGGKRRSRRAG